MSFVRGAYNRKIALYNKTKLSQPFAEFVGHTHIIWSLLGWKDYLFSGADDKTVRVWNESGECLQVINNFHTNRVDQLVIWNHRLCSLCTKVGLFRIRGNYWTPKTHIDFSKTSQRRALCVLMLSNNKRHPESLLSRLPKEILHYVLSYAIDPWE